MPSTKPKSKTVKDLWEEAWRLHGIGKIPEKEYQFHPTRRFRFDYAWPAQKVAVETDGYGGGHQTAFKLARDHEKTNEAILLGWYVIRFTSRQLGSKAKRKESAKLVLKVLKQRRLECATAKKNGLLASVASYTSRECK